MSHLQHGVSVDKESRLVEKMDLKYPNTLAIAS